MMAPRLGMKRDRAPAVGGQGRSLVALPSLIVDEGGREYPQSIGLSEKGSWSGCPSIKEYGCEDKGKTMSERIGKAVDLIKDLY